MRLDFLGSSESEEMREKSWRPVRPVGLAPGDLGSVVVLDASPLEDIRNTERISRVIRHSVVMDREAFRAQPGDTWRPPMTAVP